MTLHHLARTVADADLVARTGRVRRIMPSLLEADGPNAPLGALCHVEAGRVGAPLLAQITAIHDDHVILAPLTEAAGTWPGARVSVAELAMDAPVGDGFLGRAVDALGEPIDGLGAIGAVERGNLQGDAASPLERGARPRALETGIRAIDALLTLGQGQRAGLFAASGVGKTSLMTQLAQQVQADRCVVCLVGERGREVEAFWHRHLSTEARSRSTMVAAAADATPAMRARAADYAVTLAEHWRAQGRHVLLLIDSMTRYAMALREIGLSAGEPPTVRAYTPNVFAAIPRLLERCGARKGAGAITALVTVLSETDEVDDPLAELLKSILDGHLVLSRRLAEAGHFPAIDAQRSVSRVADEVCLPQARLAARRAIKLLSTYEASRTLIDAGVYAPGANRVLDEAIRLRDDLMSFLRQSRSERIALEASQARLAALTGGEAS